MITKEHRRYLFDNIDALIRDIHTEMLGLMDKDSTAKDRKHIKRVGSKLSAWQKEDLTILKNRLLN